MSIVSCVECQVVLDTDTPELEKVALWSDDGTCLCIDCFETAVNDGRLVPPTDFTAPSKHDMLTGFALGAIVAVLFMLGVMYL